MPEEQLSLVINEKVHNVTVEPDTPLLWVLRDHLKMFGTKFGCGMAQCGACTVVVDGEPMRSCVMPVSLFPGKKITTIEGVPEAHPVKQAWIENDVPQCGYCQSGQMMSAFSLLNKTTHLNGEKIRTAMAGNICRCGTYPKIEKAIQQAAEQMQFWTPLSVQGSERGSVKGSVQGDDA